MDIFISCIPGLEEALLLELQALQLEGKASYGGVTVANATFDDIYACNLLLRTASRVLLPLSSFVCTGKEDLYQNALKIDWESYFPVRNGKLPTFAIDATVQSPHFNNSLFAAQVMKDAICDVLRKKYHMRPSIETRYPDIQLNIFIENERATISFDTSNGPLHARGYRREQVKAPLRENLAAGILILGGYSAEDCLVDPCAGSGTFLLEAAMIATNTPPNVLRKRFGFMMHPEYSEKRWLEVRSGWLQKRRPLTSKILGIERDPEAFSLLKENIARAGFEDGIELLRADFRTAELPFSPTFTVTNPPYGKRLSEEKRLEGLYESLGDFMKQRSKGTPEKPAKGLIFTGSLYLAKKVGLRTKRRREIMNGGIECRLLEYDLY